MLEYLLGSKNKENILIFLFNRKEGYPSEIADFYNSDISPIQNQLEKMEIGNILFSKTVGRTRIYSFNPRYSFLEELKLLLEKVTSFLPEEERKRLLFNRKRPRRKGKPL
jgi:hypothetical protein